jgi:hypothetical protein
MTFITLLQPEEQEYWFQQDGATAHTANSVVITLILETCGLLDFKSNNTGFLSLGVLGREC